MANTDLIARLGGILDKDKYGAGIRFQKVFATTAGWDRRLSCRRDANLARLAEVFVNTTGH